MENNGTYSIMEKNKCKVKHPIPIISDGVINNEVLKDLHLDEVWLSEALLKQGISSSKDVFLAILQKDGLFVIKRELPSTDRFLSWATWFLQGKGYVEGMHERGDHHSDC